MEYKKGFVAELDPLEAEELANKYGNAIIEEDVAVSLIDDIKVVANNSLLGGTQPAQTIPWGVDTVLAPDAYSTSSGKGVTVCVIDTGVQRDHPDLKTNIAGGKNFAEVNGIVDPLNWNDEHGHGTHVSGIIAAIDNKIGVVGVAPKAKIFAARVFDSTGVGTLSAVIDGVNACVAQKTKIINMSLGTTGDSVIFHQALTDAKAAGIHLVAAAGNNSGAVLYPAKYPEVIAITAVDSNLSFANFSNFGEEIDFTAPGVAVQSTMIGSTYAVLSGTSMASPHAAGVLALALAKGQTEIMADFLNYLTVDQQGNGLVNALRSAQGF